MIALALEKIGAMGLGPVVGNLAASDAYVKSEIRKWARVVQAANITAQSTAAPH